MPANLDLGKPIAGCDLRKLGYNGVFDIVVG